MPRYLYSGPPTLITLPAAEGEKPKSLQLMPQSHVELDADAEMTKRWLMKKKITLVQQQPATKKKKEAVK